MVDTVQNLMGTTASVVVPEASSAPQVSTSGAGSPVEVGTTAPVVAVTETEKEERKRWTSDVDATDQYQGVRKRSCTARTGRARTRG